MTERTQPSDANSERKAQLAILLEEYGELIATHGIRSQIARDFVAGHQQYPEFRELANTAAGLQHTADQRKAVLANQGKKARTRALLFAALFVAVLLAFVGTLWHISTSAKFAKKDGERIATKAKVQAGQQANAMSEDLNELALIAITGVNGGDPESVAMGSAFLEKQINSLLPATAKASIPGLVKALEAPNAKLFAKSALWKYGMQSDVGFDYLKEKLKNNDLLLAKQLYNALHTSNPMTNKTDPEPIKVNSVVNRYLSSADPHDRVLKDSFAKVFAVELTGGAYYVVDLRGKSKDFDSLLRVEDVQGVQRAFNDDSGGTLDARILFKPTQSATHHLIATSFLPQQTGNFTLGIQEVKAFEPIKKEGQLTKLDQVDTMHKKAYFQSFDWKLDKGFTYVIDLRSTEFDTYLRLDDESGNEQARDDDGGGDLNSRIIFSPPESRMYKIVVTTFVPGDTGVFSLSVQKLHVPPPG